MQENVDVLNDNNTGQQQIAGDNKPMVSTEVIVTEGRKHNRRDNRRISDLRNIKSRKQEKFTRLTREIDKSKGDIDRGYLIVHLDEGSENQRIKHVLLDAADKDYIKAVIAEREYERYELGLDIDEIDGKISALSAVKRSSYKDKLSKKKQSKKENDLLKRVDLELKKAMNNGAKDTISSIKDQYNNGDKTSAYNSLKNFLSQEVKPVAKQLNKSDVTEKNVLDRALEKLSKVAI